MRNFFNKEKLNSVVAVGKKILTVRSVSDVLLLLFVVSFILYLFTKNKVVGAAAIILGEIYPDYLIFKLLSKLL